ncbi:hypothetical protein CDAR_577671 [Caerostris darwini]|uniref:Uncharacterized protein n=1 Tax=Caerostris darwini TaxID=1538125 RepID=A0AAV4RE07_9ARAC|nr:hypothetical protein CDAR_577671 [Caerostris darwini]
MDTKYFLKEISTNTILNSPAPVIYSTPNPTTSSTTSGVPVPFTKNQIIRKSFFPQGNLSSPIFKHPILCPGKSATPAPKIEMGGVVITCFMSELASNLWVSISPSFPK